MSLAGFAQFSDNLRTLMESDAFQNADEAKKLEMGHRLLNSKYGFGWFGGVKKLEDNKEKSEA